MTTSAIAVSLVTALRVGLASGIEGRNPMTDGFGLSRAQVVENGGLIGILSLTDLVMQPMVSRL